MNYSCPSLGERAIKIITRHKDDIGEHYQELASEVTRRARYSHSYESYKNVAEILRKIPDSVHQKLLADFYADFPNGAAVADIVYHMNTMTKQNVQLPVLEEHVNLFMSNVRERYESTHSSREVNALNIIDYMSNIRDRCRRKKPFWEIVDDFLGDMHKTAKKCDRSEAFTAALLAGTGALAVEWLPWIWGIQHAAAYEVIADLMDTQKNPWKPHIDVYPDLAAAAEHLANSMAAKGNRYL